MVVKELAQEARSPESWSLINSGPSFLGFAIYGA